MGRFQEKQLGQSRPSGTSAVSIYSPPADTTAIIKTITITNVSNASLRYKLFIDDDGTTYDETTTMAWDISLAKQTSVFIETYICMNNSTGNFAFEIDSANDATITLFGVEIS